MNRLAILSFILLVGPVALATDCDLCKENVRAFKKDSKAHDGIIKVASIICYGEPEFLWEVCREHINYTVPRILAFYQAVSEDSICEIMGYCTR